MASETWVEFRKRCFAEGRREEVKAYYEHLLKTYTPPTARNLTKKKFPPVAYVMVDEKGIESATETIPEPEDVGDVEKAYERFCAEGSGDQREAIAWVGNTLEFTSRVKVEDAPSALAWNLFRWVSQSDETRADFWKGIWPKVLPTKAQIDRDDRSAYGSEYVLKLIDRVRAAARVAKEAG